MERVYIILGSIVFLTVGCSSPSIYERMEAKQADARPSKDTYSSDLFYGGQPPLPDKPVRQWDFFYKDCELARRSLRPNRSEWECTRP